MEEILNLSLFSISSTNNSFEKMPIISENKVRTFIFADYRLYYKSYRLCQRQKCTRIIRYKYDEINWNGRLVGVVGTIGIR